MIEELIPLTTKEKALEIMLEEMNDAHSANEDAIHNWLCDQNDEVLFDGVLEEGKTIKGAVAACKENAKKKAKDGVAMIDDRTVYGWVYTYFTGKKMESTTTTTSEYKTKKKRKQEHSAEGTEQMDLFDSL